MENHPIDPEGSQTQVFLSLKKEELIKQSRQLISHSQSVNTNKAYRSDFALFEKWCREYDYISLPASEECLGNYISDLVLHDYKANTISRKLSAIRFAHETAKMEFPFTYSIQQILAGTRRHLGTKQKGKDPITIPMLQEMVHAIDGIDNEVKKKRDKAILLIGFMGAFRRSELTGIDLEDVTLVEDGLMIELKKSKTDQLGESENLAIPYGQFDHTCPVRAYIDWVSAAGIDNGPLFRSINRHGKISSNRLSDGAVAEIVKNYAGKCNYDISKYSGHSLRAGFVTTAAKAGKSEWAIAKQSRHKSMTTLRRYIRLGNAFEQNAADDLGL
ncbi:MULTISPECIES: site-specific integrase [Paenibacillus]|uniref:Site-specific integrase n=3 Tax=Paenibacillus TaxID=44249 RepID=A0ABT8JFT9_9BACL|nr:MULTISPECIES: site-specific integrase [Paenibacillus]KGP78433.1 hypothetical protein P364_0128770 [Paenibacillus sp. MAEPY2]MDN4604008.1 site-specific integrase [Paenibacillus vandeheii]